ncbi:MAG TPA: hypothetical protein VLK29_05655 [Luteimonas sp.]|nr:hypothetical protein [Luteimonas sp.]
MIQRSILRSSATVTLACALAACAGNAAPDPSDAEARFGAAGAAAATSAPAFADAAMLATAGDGAGVDGAGAGAAAGVPSQGAAGALQQVEVRDLRSGETALTVSLPAGWRVEGGVGWDDGTQCMSNRMRIQYRALSADGSHGYEVLPGYTWQVPGGTVDMNPCPVLPVTTARQWLTTLVQRQRPGARVLEYRDRPDQAEQLAAAARANPAPPAGFTYDYDAGQVLIAFQQDGRDMREVLTTSVTTSRVQGTANASAGLTTAMRAPAGQLDFAIAEQIAASARPNPQWFASVSGRLNAAESDRARGQSNGIASWHAREMGRINARGAADRAAIRSQTQGELFAIGQQTYANSQATNDEIQRQNLEGIGEYDTYRGVDGGDVRSSIHGGDRVLQRQDGSAFSTDDPYDNPAGSTELEQVR